LFYKKFDKTITVSNTNRKDMEPNEERQGNDKKAERLAKRRERRRQRLLEETAEEREARLGKRREAWKKKTAEAKGKQRSCLYNAMYQLYCSYTS
jgi:hypothetical protein